MSIGFDPPPIDPVYRPTRYDRLMVRLYRLSDYNDRASLPIGLALFVPLLFLTFVVLWPIVLYMDGMRALRRVRALRAGYGWRAVARKVWFKLRRRH
jgi:hypothetical protein